MPHLESTSSAHVKTNKRSSLEDRLLQASKQRLKTPKYCFPIEPSCDLVVQFCSVSTIGPSAHVHSHIESIMADSDIGVVMKHRWSHTRNHTLSQTLKLYNCNQHCLNHHTSCKSKMNQTLIGVPNIEEGPHLLLPLVLDVGIHLVHTS